MLAVAVARWATVEATAADPLRQHIADWGATWAAMLVVATTDVMLAARSVAVEH